MGASNPTSAPLTWETLTRGLWKENPVFVMLLGCCPVMAVTNSARNALAMGVATGLVLACSGVLVSMLRKLIPKQVRIAAFIIIIATFVTIADYAIQAISLDLYNALGAFIPLIVVNCIILGRAEAYASKHPVLHSLVDGIGMGLGFTFALLCMGVVREVLGSGTLFGFSLFGPRFQPWAVFVLPPGGFFVIAAWLVLFSTIRRARERREKEAAHAS